MKFENLHEVEAWSAGGPPPPGIYTCKVDDAKEGESSKGNPQLELTWTVTAGEFRGAEVRDWLVVVEATRGKVVALLQATGVTVPAGEFELRVSDLIGRSAEVVMRQEPSFKDPDKTVVRVAGYRPVSQSTPAAGASTNGTGAAKPKEGVPF